MEAVPYTIFRLGPGYLTESYPVDTDCIAKEILSKKGVIGPEYYVVNGITEVLKKYDSLFWGRDGNEEYCRHFKNDLLILAEKYRYSGAYTLLASIHTYFDDQKSFMKLAAEQRNPEGMVSYGIFLVQEGNYKEGFPWVLRGADTGQEDGQLFVAISYHYGTASPLDYDEAAYWYRRAIEDNKNFHAANNLGALYMEVGYYAAALKLFKKAKEYCTGEFEENKIEYMREDGMKDVLSNIDSCRKILKKPLARRAMMFTLQVHDSRLEAMFCCIWDKDGRHVSPPPVFDNTCEVIPKWNPKNKSDIWQEDFMRKILLFRHKIKKYFSSNNRKDNMLLEENSLTALDGEKELFFVTVEVELKKRLFVPNQHELIFFERRVHGMLNQFISRNLLRLDNTFRKHGFFLTYLPALVKRSDNSDVIGYYVADLESLEGFLEFVGEKRTEDIFQYWEYLKEVSLLPPDCAGFLHYNPYRSMTSGALSFDYIMMPFMPDIDFEKMFEVFIGQLDKLPIKQIKLARDEYQDVNLLAPTNRLEIGADYNITLVTFNGTRVKVKMPALSLILFMFFLKETEGIVLKQLSEKRSELLNLYVDISHRNIDEASIDRLVDPTCNSVNEKISRIRRAFVDALGEYASEADLYTPRGIPGEAYRITVSRNSISYV